MDKNFKNRLLRTALMSLIAFAIGGGIAYYQIINQPSSVSAKESKATPSVPGMEIGGPFTLTDHNGNDVTEKNYENSHKLIYFGFTYCPAICPTELQKMTRVMKDLGPLAEKIQPIFITVDPERDTPEVMNDYIKLFKYPRMVGLTGTTAQIDNIKKNYRVFATKVQEEGANDYTVDHSSFIYLMSPYNRLISIYRMQDKVPFIIEDIQRKIPFES